jgi:hypothetical protein
MVSYDRLKDLDEQDSKALPHLMGAHRQSTKDSVKEMNMDLISLKRLNFLRNSLDAHNARVTTENLRENASTKRDERILELWSKDQAKPSVRKLVEDMHKSRQSMEKQNYFGTNTTLDDLDES